MVPSKRVFLSLGLTLLLCWAMPVSPGRADETAGTVSTGPDKVAIQGFDPVAYFTMNRPAKGQPEYEYSWHGARWLFMSEEHRDLFAKNPDAYAPRFGGFCAWAMSQNGIRVPADPQHWIIRDGRLYLSAARIVPDDLTDMPTTISKAQSNWVDISQ